MTHSRDFQPAPGREQLSSAPPPDYVWPNGLDDPYRDPDSLLENTGVKGRGETDVSGYVSGSSSAHAQKKKNLRRRLYQSGAAGASYLLWALSDIFMMLASPFLTAGDLLFEIGFRLAVVGLPTALMVWRTGMISACCLSVLAVLLGLGAFGDGEGVSGLFHLFFAGAFLRGAWVARKLRKLTA